MGGLVRLILNNPLVRPVLQPVVRPITRLLIGLIAIPLFRLVLKRVARVKSLDLEMEKDFEEWFRASLLLLAATRNMETLIFPWVTEEYQDTGETYWMMVGLRVLLAIGVIEAMPDQGLFQIIYPGPPKLNFSRDHGIFREIRERFREIVTGYLCQYINRSSPVFAIMATIAEGWIGWVCYGLAVAQYLLIGLVTSRDKARDVLSAFDHQVALRRQQLVDEFQPAPESHLGSEPEE